MTFLSIVDWSNIGVFEVTVAVIGMVVVYASLIMLVVFFLWLPKVVHFNYRRFFRMQGHELTPENGMPTMSAETNAAIAMALYLYFNELHDKESNVLTMNRIEKRYSPWSSKIYNIKNNPFR
jgi:hypothetical protein